MDEMHWKLQHLHPPLVNRMGPILLHDNVQQHISQPMLQKLNELDHKVLPYPHIHRTSHQLTTTSSSIFLQGTHFNNQQEAENAFQEFTESWSMDFYITGINLFLMGKSMLIVMVPILTNKDVFEPSYNDLKITVRKHNYVCTNLNRNRQWFKIGKWVCQGCILSPCLFNLNAEYIMQNAVLDHSGMRLPGEIPTTSDMQMIPP